MDNTPHRRLLHNDAKSDPSFSSRMHTDYRTQLNNWLQVNGGVDRLEWESHRDGPGNCPTWTAICIIDGVEWDRADARKLGEAKEEAARKVLRTLNFKRIPNVGQPRDTVPSSELEADSSLGQPTSC